MNMNRRGLLVGLAAAFAAPAIVHAGNLMSVRPFRIPTARIISAATGKIIRTIYPDADGILRVGGFHDPCADLHIDLPGPKDSVRIGGDLTVRNFCVMNLPGKGGLVDFTDRTLTVG